MSHVEGHIEELPQSCGKLHLANSEETVLDFVPPPFIITQGTKVGFHPIYKDANHDEILAVDIVLWQDHETAELVVKGKLPGKFKKIEEIHDRDTKKAEVEALLSYGNMTDRHKDVIQKTLDYFKQQDFPEFYVGTNGKADSANAERKIIKIMKAKRLSLKKVKKSPASKKRKTSKRKK